MVSAGKHFDRVLIIVLENQNYTSAMNDPFWGQLAQMGASLNNFQALMHPSYPNYRERYVKRILLECGGV